jgi:hypothetical protein
MAYAPFISVNESVSAGDEVVNDASIFRYSCKSIFE